MFSREEFLSALPVSFEGTCPLIDAVEFGPDAFRCPCGEEQIRIHRGKRANFKSIVQFWVASLSSQDWKEREAYFLPYLQSGKCRPISENEFNDLVTTYSGELQQRLALPLHSAVGFINAVQMYDEWNDMAAVAEYEDEFVAFYWDTTA
jgi:hypothetical protein